MSCRVALALSLVCTTIQFRERTDDLGGRPICVLVTRNYGSIGTPIKKSNKVPRTALGINFGRPIGLTLATPLLFFLGLKWDTSGRSKLVLLLSGSSY